MLANNPHYNLASDICRENYNLDSQGLGIKVAILAWTRSLTFKSKSQRLLGNCLLKPRIYIAFTIIVLFILCTYAHSRNSGEEPQLFIECHVQAKTEGQFSLGQPEVYTALHQKSDITATPISIQSGMTVYIPVVCKAR